MTDNDSYTAAYSYAADGLRLRAQESNHEHADRFFLYDGVRPTAEGTLSGDTWTTTQRYVWEGDSYYSPLVYLVWDNDRYYPLFDGLGSTRQLTDEDEDVTDTYSYEAFGNSMGSTGSTTNPYRYVGSLGYYQIYPSAGGPALMHLGARYYMPEVGRFVTQEPIVDRGGINRYAYAGGDPIGRIDPQGTTSVRYIVGGLIMWHYYDEMRDRNWRGADAYYHCLASCKAARVAGPDVAWNLGLFREFTDWARGRGWSNDDLRSDLCGILSSPFQSCEDRCRPLAPPGMLPTPVRPGGGGGGGGGGAD